MTRRSPQEAFDEGLSYTFNPAEPSCLTDAESQQLADECMAEMAGEQTDAMRHMHRG